MKDWPIETLKDILHAPVEEDDDEKEDEYYINTENVHKHVCFLDYLFEEC